MEVNVTRKDIRAMALILTAVEQECSRILDEMNEEDADLLA